MFSKTQLKAACDKRSFRTARQKILYQIATRPELTINNTFEKRLYRNACQNVPLTQATEKKPCRKIRQKVLENKCCLKQRSKKSSKKAVAKTARKKIATKGGPKTDKNLLFKVDCIQKPPTKLSN